MLNVLKCIYIITYLFHYYLSKSLWSSKYLRGNNSWQMTDDLFFLAELAKKLNFPEGSLEFLNQIIKTNPSLEPNVQKFYIDLYFEFFRSYVNVLRKIQEKIDAQGMKLGQIKLLQTIRTRYETSFVNLHNSFIDQVKNKLLSSVSDLNIQFSYLKAIGDSYQYISGHIKGETFTKKQNEAKESYEHALKIANMEFQHSDPRYLRIVLNWAVFQYRFLKLKESPTKQLFKCYQESLNLLEKVDLEKRMEFCSIMELIKTNMSTWSTKPEELKISDGSEEESEGDEKDKISKVKKKKKKKAK
ncbi:14-3-3 protein [Tritrichomonas foetus]|uniref:14-3-3 protein n=1 Tax=Tritrichomonas foetus TaxID=1144522 RepID=A0A1J4KD95_9EUKA|nr:14-3-3 protein [Tritrichomonas foetus]|eukprot:OHT07598.1 14-3-3 protein [Tritrichomonas foetus]